MEKFEEEKTTYENEISELQHNIAALLEHMAKHMKRKENLPTAGEVND